MQLFGRFRLISDIGPPLTSYFLICLLEHTGWCRNMASVTQEGHEPHLPYDEWELRYFPPARELNKHSKYFLMSGFLACVEWVWQDVGRRFGEKMLSWGKKSLTNRLSCEVKLECPSWEVMELRRQLWARWHSGLSLCCWCAGWCSGTVSLQAWHPVRVSFSEPRGSWGVSSCLVALDATKSEVSLKKLSHQKAETIKQWQIPKHRQESDERPAASQIVAVWKETYRNMMCW